MTLEPEVFVKRGQGWKHLERRGIAESQLPPLLQRDDACLNIRKIPIEGEELGLKRVGPRALNTIKTVGNDAFFLSETNSYTKIGFSGFLKLAAMGRSP